MTPPQIARIALAVELEDGSTVRLYSGEVGGSVEVKTEYGPPVRYADVPGRLFPPEEPPRTTITIEGIHAYLVQYGDPNATKAIDQAREELQQ